MALFSSSSVQPPEFKPTFPIEPKADVYGSSKPMSTVIAKGVKVEGDFASDGDVQIEGEVKGKLTTKGRLVVGPEAVIVANIDAGDAVIAGKVEGNVTVERKVELKSTANITGDITGELFAAEAGAKLTGKISIGQKEK